MTSEPKLTHVEMLARDIRAGLSILVIAMIVYWLLPIAKDDTDPSSGRSGMSLHTDAKTGCQYLSTSGGGITPRLDAEGRHAGCRSALKAMERDNG